MELVIGILIVILVNVALMGVAYIMLRGSNHG
jgi:hypothetical protein